MLLRKALITAFVLVPLALTPTSAEAQKRMLGRHAALQARVHQAASFDNGQAARRPADLPPGVKEVFAGGNLPPGLRWNREPAAPVENDNGSGESDSGDGTQSSGDSGGQTDSTCQDTVVIVNGLPTIQEVCS